MSTTTTTAAATTDDAPAPRGGLAGPGARLTLLIVVLALVAVGLSRATDLSVDGLRDLVDGAGWAAPLAFVLIYAALTVLVLPAWIATAASGLLFGVVAGTALTVVGATGGATLAFLIGRRAGRGAVEQLVGSGGRIDRLDAWISRRGLVAVLYVRLIPLFPFNVINYAAGLTGLRLRDFVIGTAVGIIPGSFAYAALGGNLDDPTSPAFLAAVGLVLVLLVVGPILARRTEARDAAEPAA